MRELGLIGVKIFMLWVLDLRLRVLKKVPGLGFKAYRAQDF